MPGEPTRNQVLEASCMRCARTGMGKELTQRHSNRHRHTHTQTRSQRQRQRQKHRHTHTQRHRQKETHTQRQRQRQKETHTHTQRQGQRQRQRQRHTHTHQKTKNAKQENSSRFLIKKATIWSTFSVVVGGPPAETPPKQPRADENRLAT